MFNKVNLTFLFVTVLASWSCWINFASAIENKSSVVSPYWQSDSTSYTFIAVSHSSLSSIASKIGLVVHAIQSDLNTFGTAITFTISGGSTKRIFIIRTNSSINPTSIPTAEFIVGTTDFKHGQMRIEPLATNPTIALGGNNGRQDITMLNFWGAVVIEASTTGFAMEFIGDMHDSVASSGMDGSATVSGIN